ncbi:Ribosomal RNA-processing protein 12-like conserved domain-containing protein [Entamoeba marina]
MDIEYTIYSLFPNSTTPLHKATLVSIENILQNKNLPISHTNIFVQTIPHITPAIVMNDSDRLSKLITELILIELFNALETLPNNVEKSYDHCIVGLLSNTTFATTFSKVFVQCLQNHLNKHSTTQKALKLTSHCIQYLSLHYVNSLLNKIKEIISTAVETSILVSVYQCLAIALNTNIAKDQVSTLYTTLLNHPPTALDTAATIAYSKALLNVPCLLGRIDAQEGITSLLKITEIIEKSYRNSPNQSTQFTEVLSNCLTKTYAEPFASMQISPLQSQVNFVVQTLLSTQNRSLLPTSLIVTKTFISRSKPDHISTFSPLLIHLDSLHKDTNLSTSVDKCFIAAFEHLGVEGVLNQLPLDLDASTSQHSYLLTLLHHCHLHSSLSYYHSLLKTLLPRLDNSIANSQNLPVREKNLKQLRYQLFTLLDRFIINPTDYSYLPQLSDVFLLLIADVESAPLLADILDIKQQKPILITIGNILKQTPGNLANLLFKNVIIQIAKHRDQEVDNVRNNRLAALLDLVRVFSDSLDNSSVDLVVNAISPLHNDVPCVSKPSIKTLESITKFLDEWFIKGTTGPRENSRAVLSGFQTYLNVLKQNDSLDLKERTTDFLAFLINLTKEKSSKTRSAAYEAVDGVIQLHGAETTLQMICAFITVDPHTSSCALNALSRFIFTIFNELDDGLKQLVFEVVLKSLTPSREQTKSSLAVIKVLFQTDSEYFSTKLREIFRTQLKQLVERFIRKYTVEVVSKQTPQNASDIVKRAKKYRSEKKRKIKKTQTTTKSGKGGNLNEEEEDIIMGVESGDSDDEKDERKRIVHDDDVDLLQMKFVKETTPKRARKLGEVDFDVDDEGKLLVNTENGKEPTNEEEMNKENDNEIADRKVVKVPKIKTKEIFTKERKKVVDETTGSKFKAKKAAGDVMKNGVQPYAYIPLARSSKKAKFETSTAFKELVGKRKGASLKGKVKLSKRKTK